MKEYRYIVYGNTYYGDSYGAEISLFGIFNTFEKAEEAKKKAEENYWESHNCVGIGNPSSRGEVEFEIVKMEVDKIQEKYLGGYVE